MPINGSYKSNDESDDETTLSNSSSFKSTSSSSENLHFNEDEIGYFIERPTISWKTFELC